MSAMITEVYDALRSVGVDEGKATAAAEAMFSHDLATRGDVARMEKGMLEEGRKNDARFIRLERDLFFLKWCVGGIFVMMLAEFVRNFFA